LQKSLGTKTQVSFNWNKGSLTAVRATFDVPSNHPLREIVKLSHDAVLAEFQQQPKEILIAFSIRP
jgi:hypothetical protein